MQSKHSESKKFDSSSSWNKSNCQTSGHLVAIGTNAERPVVDDANRILVLYNLQSLARELLPRERVADCLRTLAPGRDEVLLVYNRAKKRAYYRNLVVCSRIWQCPVCANRMSEVDRAEMQQALKNASDQGLRVALITYTASHDASESLSEVLGRVKASRVALKEHRKFKADFKARWNWTGSICATEAPFGKNGWHVHFHELCFLRTYQPLAGAAKDRFEAELKEAWLAALKRSGGSGLWSYALNVSTRRGDLVEYVTKYGRLPDDEKNWGASGELSKTLQKKTESGLSWLELLQSYSAGNSQAGARFVEFSEAMKHKEHLVWSRGLKRLLNIVDVEPVSEGLTDDDQISEYERLLLALTPVQWKLVTDAHLRGELRLCASAGDPALLWRWFKDHFGIDLWQVFKLSFADWNENGGEIAIISGRSLSHHEHMAKDGAK